MTTLTTPHKVRLIATLTMLGFSAGLPWALIFSTLSLWLVEAGVQRAMVTMFSLAGLGYSFKFVWSPLMENLTLPVLTRWFGKRRSWLFLAQVLMISALCLMAFSQPNPADMNSLYMMAAGSVLLGFSSATQDVVIDAYRIEIAPENMQSALSASYTAGYRLGMVVSGAGSLFIAAYLGSSKAVYSYEAWRNTYLIMAAIMGLCVLVTLLIREPETSQKNAPNLSPLNNVRLLAMFVVVVASFVGGYIYSGKLPWFETGSVTSPLGKFLLEAVHFVMALGVAVVMGWLAVTVNIVDKQIAIQTWVSPVSDFFQRYGKQAAILLALIGLYRISDIVSGVISNVFYTDLGFSKQEIAWAVKTFGVIMSIVGGFAGGLLAQKFRIMKMMMFGAIAASATNLLFILLAMRGHDVSLMYTAVGLDNFAAGLAGTVFIAFLSSLTNIKFTAVQYALFSSLMSLSPKILGGYSGAIVDSIGYPNFFAFTAALGLPILGLIWWADRVLMQHQEK